MTATTRTLTITLALPDRALCGNGTARKFERSALVADQRRDAALCGYQALAAFPESLRGPLFPADVRVRVDVLVKRTRQWAARRMDDDNLIRGLKASMDGLTDAGIWHDDRQVRWGDIAWQLAAPGEHGITLVVREDR